ncbi:MAG: heparinase II/III family protein, partial [Candidatus Kapaibacterium sp.]
MNLSWTLRILRGPMRPFLVGKVLDRFREIVETRRALNRIPSAVSEGRSVRSNIVPLPSAQWFAVNSNAVLAFARRMRAGRVDAYGIGRWMVGDEDPAEVDVRSVHELSRMHHWCTYALAAHLDPENRDAWCELLEHEIQTFTSSYPIASSVHWQFPMGTGIRLHSMLVAWDWARRSGWESPDGDRLVAAAAIDHALLTAAQRESRGGLSTSHYAANLLGVLAAGCYVTGHPKTERWKKLATRELCHEIMRQILPDGMANEGSTGYHRQVTDTFLHAMMICQGADGQLPLSPEQHQRLALAVERCRQLTDLGMPLIGDNDDGLSMKLAGFAPDLSYLNDVSSRLGLRTSSGEPGPPMPDVGLYTLE